MKTETAIAHFGSAAKVAEALHISRPAVSQWGETVPLGMAALLEKITQGALVFDADTYLRKRISPAPDEQDRAA